MRLRLFTFLGLAALCGWSRLQRHLGNPRSGRSTYCIPYKLHAVSFETHTNNQQDRPMKPSDFGQFVAALIIQTSKKELSNIQEHVGRDRAATSANLTLAMTWVGQMKIEQVLTEAAAPEATHMMLAYVMNHVMETTGWSYPTMCAVLKNRLEGYDTAFSDGEGEPLLNITKYFTACCEELRHDVQYDEIIPDPDEVQSLGDAVNKDALAELRRLRREGNCPTYSLAALATCMAGVTIFSVEAGIEAAVGR